jgi:hypothetical protein
MQWQLINTCLVGFIYFNRTTIKMNLKTLTKSRFAGNSKFVNFLQTRKSEHFIQNVRFLTIFVGEGG